MAQLTIYLPDSVEAKARKAAKASKKSVSRWIAERVINSIDDTWPAAVIDAAGSIPDFPSLKKLRQGYGKDVPPGIRRVILLDTNTLIYYVKGVESVVARLQATSPRDVAIPSVVVYEFHYGTLVAGTALALRRKDILTRLLAAFPQVPFDHAAALEAARIRVQLERKGQVIGPLDLLIAGTALSRAATLATSNTREFSRISGLKLVDWNS